MTAAVWPVTLTVVHGETLYKELLARVSGDAELVAAMWVDAECLPDELDVAGTLWSVVLVGDGIPAAWAAARIDDGKVIRCFHNYEVPRWRGRGLYPEAYYARHRDVLLAHKRPAVTYLFEAPIGLHEANGWYRTGSKGIGETGHQWWELRRPGAVSSAASERIDSPVRGSGAHELLS